jgi:hypothetical protein
MHTTSRLRPVAVAALALIAGACADPATPPTAPASASPDISPAGDYGIITNGTVQLGVRPLGNLITPPGINRSSGQGITNVGLRFVPTNAEAAAQGGQYEGWGVADAAAPTFTGDAGRGSAAGRNLTAISFGAPNGQSLTSIAEAGNAEAGKRVRVTHEFFPSPATSNLYEVVVTVQNVGSAAVGDLRYRRVLDFGPEPTAFSGYHTLQGADGAANVIRATDNFFVSTSPLSAHAPLHVGHTGSFTDVGPSDEGVAIDLGFGALAPGASRRFSLFFGAAASRAAALTAIRAAGAEVYALAAPGTAEGLAQGSPNTFIFALRGVGGQSLNQPPVPVLGFATARPAVVGTPVTVTTAASDAEGDAPLSCQVIWGDNSQTEPFACGASVSHAYTAPTMSVLSVQLRATDPSGAVGVATDTLRVLAAPTQGNRAPTATIAGPSTAVAGALVSFTTGAADADADSPLVCTVSFGDGGAAVTLAGCGAGATHTFASGTYTVTITARDPSGATGTATTSIAVSAAGNPAPVATLALAPKTLAVGAATTATIGATDANDAPAALGCTVQWGDGQSATPAACAGALTHAYAAPGLYTVTLTARDPRGATGTAQDSVRVLAAETPNRAPEVHGLVVADGRGQPYAGSLAVSTASCRSADGTRQYTACVRFGFRDADGATDAPWSAQVDWGDGTAWSPNALPAQSASVLAPHRYAAPGSYAVRVRVTDRRGLSGEQTITLVVGAQ